jgi:FkbM family methyltransferase
LAGHSFFLNLANKFSIPGIIWIGANDAKESFELNGFGIKKAIFIEADTEVFKKLKKNIKKYKNYIALNYLVADGKKYKFNIANNKGLSSSIFELAQHKKMLPDVYFKKSFIIKSFNIKEIIKINNILLNNYQSLVLDVQGVELIVLKSFSNLLKNFKYIKLEAVDFEMYKNNPSIKEISDYLFKYGFKELKRFVIKSNPKIGKLYEVIYLNKHFF